jgi:hypothetical protein
VKADEAPLTFTLRKPVTPSQLIKMIRAKAPHFLLPEDARPVTRPAVVIPGPLPVAAVAEILRRRHPAPVVAPGDQLIGRAEAAAILGVDPPQVTSMACQGKLPTVWTQGARRKYRESDVLKLRDALWPPQDGAA